MKVTISFNHNETHYVGLLKADQHRCGFEAQMEKQPGKPQIRQRPPTDPHGVKAARRKFLEKDSRAVWGCWPETAVSQKEFEEFFIEAVKRHALDWAARYHVVLVPTNYVEEIWTAEHVIALASRLRKKSNPGKYARQNQLDWLLLENWERKNRTQKPLCEMNKGELCAWANAFFPGKPFSATAVRARADRLGLSSDLTPGPKPT